MARVLGLMPRYIIITLCLQHTLDAGRIGIAGQGVGIAQVNCLFLHWKLSTTRQL